MKEPPVIPNSRRVKITLFVLVVVAAALVALVVALPIVRPQPPKETELIQQFHKNRAAFEQIKEMFKADQSVALQRVGAFGIVTRRPVFEGKPTAADFLLDRYQQCLRLLNQVGGAQGYRLDRSPANPIIPVWGARWLDHYMNIHIAWLNEVPANQVTNLEQCRIPKWNQQLFHRDCAGHKPGICLT